MRIATFVLFSLAAVLVRNAAYGQVNADLDKHRFGVLEKLTRDTLGKDEWKKPGWKDPGFETEFKRLVDEVAGLTETRTTKVRLKLPVSLAAVTYVPESAKQPAWRGRLVNELLITGDATLNSATDSIILADGNVYLGYAYRCVIFSRGVTTYAHGQGNLIIAGHYIRCATDLQTDAEENPVPKHPSLMLSGRYLRISGSKHTICHARLVADVTGVDHTVFLNCRGVRTPHYQDKDYSMIQDHSFRFFDKSRRSDHVIFPSSPLSKYFSVTGTEPIGNEKRELHLVTNKKGEEKAMREGDLVATILNSREPEVAGWRLSYVDEKYVHFTKGKEDTGFWIPGK